MMNRGQGTRQGLTLIETLIGTSIFAIVAFSIYFSFANLIDITTVSKLNTAAAAVLESQVEIIRNIPFEDIGVQGSYPTGVFPKTQAVVYDGVPFVVTYTVRNIDDPFDGTIGGAPNDTAPADYKLVELEISCPQCLRFLPLVMTARVAPQGLETTSNNGALFVNVFDASGAPIAEADVTIVNTSTNPAITITDTTNVDGMLQLVDIATSSAGYRITVTKNGYSTDKTYSPGDAGNPNPILPHASVASQQITQVSFAIDRTSSFALETRSEMCGVVGNINFNLAGSKIIGTGPDVLKFSTSSATDGNGNALYGALEWDSYAIVESDPNYDIAGFDVDPENAFFLAPSSSHRARWMMKTSDPSSLVVTVLDENGARMNNATTTLSRTGYSATRITGRETRAETDWSGAGAYDSQSGGLQVTNPGIVTLTIGGSGYPTSTDEWLISNTLDFGSSSAEYYSLDWLPGAQPLEAGPQSIGFQIASNNDNATWNFQGPDGTSSTAYAANGTAILGHAGSRYMRYRVVLRTENEGYTPSLEEVRIGYHSGCVADGQSFFTNLAQDTYTLSVERAGYQPYTTNVDVVANWQEVTAQLAPL